MVKVWGGNHSEMAFKVKTVETTKAECPGPKPSGQHSAGQS